MSDELTRPHDYRALLETCPDLTIVGGQAVSVWAITYLNPEETRLEGFGSHDMDVLAKMKVAEIIAALPNWKSEKPPMWSFDRRLLRLTSRAEDGRLLIIEVLGKVHGLEKEDLEAVAEIEHGGVKYRVLDPVAMIIPLQRRLPVVHFTKNWFIVSRISFWLNAASMAASAIGVVT